MPAIFEDGSYTGTLENGDDELDGQEFILNKPIKDATFYFDSAGSGEVKLQVAFWNGGNFMKYHDMKEDNININIVAGDSAEYGLKIQEFWKEPIFGYKTKLVRVSGSGDVLFTNARTVYST